MEIPFDETILGSRYESFKLAIDEMDKHQGNYIVETGCIRWAGDLESGGSTCIFALLAKNYGCKFDSIDFSPISIAAATETLSKDAEFVTFHEGDSIETLQNWDKPIDLLYLDSLGCSAEPLPAQEHQLKEIEAAYSKLTKHAVVLLDDNRAANGGKTVLAKKFLFNRGWKILVDSTQCLLVRGDQ